jgi:AAA15 family ATPase/GTPase
MPKSISQKEKIFCLNYLANGNNATRAYIDAGYSENGARVTAHQTLKRQHIKEFLSKFVDEKVRKLEITFEWKLEKLKQCVEAAMLEDPETGQVLLDNHSALLGAITELNKMQGHYAATKVDTIHTLDFADELKELIRQNEREC